MQAFYLYLIALPIFVIIDIVWLGFIAKNFYTSQIGHLMGPINWPFACMLYLILVAGMVMFVIYPAFLKDSLLHALIYGALCGFFVYAIYDLTNLATLKDWPLTVSLVDMAWGATLGASASFLSVYIGRFFIS